VSDGTSSRATVLVLDDEFRSALPEVAARYPGLDLHVAGDADDAAVAGVITQLAPLDADLVGRFGGLRAVLKLGRSHHNIDVDAVRARGVAFGSVPRKGPNCVAELAVTFVLALSKDLLVSHESVSEGAYRYRGLRPERSAQWKMAFHWMRHTTLHEVTGKTLGIVGMGEIGIELARRAQALGMTTVYTKRSPLTPELERRFASSYRELDALLSESDYVCLAVPHTDETEGMIGRDQLARMKESAFLVNICRGGVVDEEALVEALQERRIAGAGLDVFTYEPLPADSPLCFLDNVILTPHVGGGSGTNRVIELGAAVDEMVRLLDGQRPAVDLSHPA
jgi:phosphoglycerate dehydrogenase-like enzyme